MPELPEIFTIKTDLQKELAGKKILFVKTHNNFSLKPSKSFFDKHVIGHKVKKVSNFAKLLTIDLSSNTSLAVHLNMTGLLLYNVKDPYIKVTVELEGGNKLYYSSVRMFGFFEAWTQEELKAYTSRYGKGALDENLSAEDFANTLKKRSTNVKVALLDQKLISGIGNIYANDALFLSGIHPKTKTGELSNKQYKKLFESVRTVLNEGIKHRGSSIDRYRDIYNKLGTQQNYFRVYGKTGKPCQTCKAIVRFEKIQQRGSFFCPNCQPLHDQLALH